MYTHIIIYVYIQSADLQVLNLFIFFIIIIINRKILQERTIKHHCIFIDMGSGYIEYHYNYIILCRLNMFYDWFDYKY